MSASKVLVIDEFGVWPCDRLTATAFFALISARRDPSRSSKPLRCR
jgi:DNA replication protein DnaC